MKYNSFPEPDENGDPKGKWKNKDTGQKGFVEDYSWSNGAGKKKKRNYKNCMEKTGPDSQFGQKFSLFEECDYSATALAGSGRDAWVCRQEGASWAGDGCKNPVEDIGYRDP